MRQVITAILAAMPLLGPTACDDAASDGGVATPTADRGAILIEAIAEDFLDDQVAVIDIRIRSAKPAELAIGRVVWPNAKHRLVTVSTRCDPADNPFSADATLVGLYDQDPGAVGAFGEAAPAGSVAIDGALEQHIDITCIAGESFGYRFVFSVSSSQPAVALDASVEAGVVGDALWTVVASAGDPAAELWQDRITSAFWGDGEGGFAYPAPCSTYDASPPEMTLTLELLALYADPLPLVGNVGDPVPDGALEAWLPGSLARQIACAAGTAAFAGVDVTVARVERETEVARAAFAGVVCRAAWLCEDATSATLDFACRAAGDQAPVLYLDDLAVRCGDPSSLSAIDPSAGEISEDIVGDVAWTVWRVPVAPELAAGQPCTLTARGTAATRDRAYVEEPSDVFTSPPPGAWMKNGAVPAGAVYPLVSWSVPLGDAAGAVCQEQRLGLGGAITITYTGTGDAETTFDHDSL